MGPIGIPEMMAIFMIALLLFGPKKLPELGRTLGKALSEFRRAKNELKSTLESHMQELEREVRIESDTKSLPPYTPSSPADYSSVHYPYPYDDYSPSEPPVGESSYPTQPAELAAEERQALPAPSVEEPPTAVEGVVARSNGVHPVQQPAKAAEQEHPA